MTIHTIAVIGAGTMGRGIIESAVVHGISVRAFEADEHARTDAVAKIETSIAKGIKRGKVDLAEPAEALQRVTWAETIDSAAADSEFVIEAVPETESLKADIFRQLDAVCGPSAILASNTSSISITRLAAVTQRPEQVVGMHFFNPVPVMPPVETVRGLQTSEETLARTSALAEQMGKQAFTVSDTPGFAVNRVLMPLINEAVFALQEGVADAKTIDSLMKLGCNQPMGPLELVDFVGLDVCLSILRVLHGGLGDPKFRPCTLLVRTVDAGHLGRKTGRGFYEYS
ncbi:MAG: 3-hydroxyacyl-CoA dehydrogenase family protein [Planctomycetaceae bacterium]